MLYVRSLVVFLAFLNFCVAGLPSGVAIAAEYATPPILLQAGKVLPANLITGKNYRIEDNIYNDGMFNLFTLTTDYGAMTAESEAVLRIRLSELNALTMMQEMERKKVFGDALVESVKAPFKGAAALVTSPIETSKQIVEGTGQFFSNVGRALVSDDPAQDNALKVAIGYDVAKRKFAYEFDINPYTTNEPVSDRLGEIARASVAGGVTTKVAMAAVDSVVVTGLRIAGTAQSMKMLVRDNPPGKLREINRKKLTGMGVSSSLADAFLDNHNFDPYEETLLVGELDAMKGIKGRNLFIARAEFAATPKEAIVLRRQAQMIGGYHTNVARVAAMVNIGGVLALKKKNGGLTVVLPTDMMFLTKELEKKIIAFDRQAGPGTERDLLVSGSLDKALRDYLSARGWKITENAATVLFKGPAQ